VIVAAKLYDVKVPVAILSVADYQRVSSWKDAAINCSGAISKLA
jgi:hypothetical protein